MRFSGGMDVFPERLILAAVFAFGLALAFRAPVSAGARDTFQTEALEEMLPAEKAGERPAYLYFAAKEPACLGSEARGIDQTKPPQAYCRRIVEALIAGPSGGLVRTIPEGTELRALYITDDAVAYVDLSAAVSKNHPGGIRTEMLTVYSIVNSLVLNVSAVDRVKLLVRGRESDTLAGHIDIRFPLQAKMLLVR
ncbi:MAG: GerMN domain-containing protein [Desulfosalsimonadaceae bacterium]